MSFRYHYNLDNHQNSDASSASSTSSVNQQLYLCGTLKRAFVQELWTNTQKWLSKISKSRPKSTAILNCSQLEEIDSAGIAYIIETQKFAQGVNITLRLQDLSQHLINRLNIYQSKVSVPSQQDISGLGKLTVFFTKNVGHGVDNRIKQIILRIRFLGDVLIAFGRVLIQPSKFRKLDFYDVMHQMGVNGLPIVLVIGFMVGVVLSFQTLVALRNFGSDIFVVNTVAIAVFRGLGPFITAILVAGKTGSSFAAELGAMKINEEINALKTMGIHPTVFLVLPRMLAMTLITPILNIFFVVFSMIGMAIVLVASGMPYTIYLVQLKEAIGINSVMITLIKPFFFGTLIAFVGCYRGLFSDNDSRAIGRATTNSMVDSLIGILFLDGLYSIIIYVFDL